MKYSIGSNLYDESIFIIETLRKKNNIRKSDIEIFLSYPGSIFGMKRNKNKNITFKKFIKHLKLIKYFGYKINYVFNAPHLDFVDYEALVILKNEIKLLKDLKIDIITIANLELLKIIKSEYLNVKVVLSTILNIDNVDKLNKILSEKYEINRIILGIKLNKNLNIIKKISDICNEKGIETEIVVNQTCSIKCNVIYEHYTHAYNRSINNKLKDFKCPYIINTNNYLDENGSFIKPELTFEYEKHGIIFFKLATRNCSKEYLLNTVNAYFLKKIQKKCFI